MNLGGAMTEEGCEAILPPVTAAKLIGLCESFSRPHMDCWVTLVKESLNSEYSCGVLELCGSMLVGAALSHCCGCDCTG